MKKTDNQRIKEALYDFGRRNFIKTAAKGALAVPAMGFSVNETDAAEKKPKVRTREEKLKSMASNSYAVNILFKRRTSQQRTERPEVAELKKKYRELTLLEFPRFSKDTYPGVKAMDLWSSLFGDVTDDTMFTKIERDNQVRPGEFDPSSPSSKKYLDELVKNMVANGVMATRLKAY